ncbi:MAG: CcmD family protein [candidate division Zixibacteria bacterium]|nr:CcmD family protein [candidate division Zixibacteria bacterium]
MDGNYIAMIVVLIVWLGIFFYIFRLDKKVENFSDKP